MITSCHCSIVNAKDIKLTGDILIWGAGAIGGTVGAVLKSKGVEVAFVDLEPNHVEAIRDPRRGLQINGPVHTARVCAEAFTPLEISGQWKHIFLCVKAHHTRQACRALAPHLTDDGFVLSLQNGLCEQVIADIVGIERTIGAFVNFGADWIGPGEIIYANRGAVVLGEMDGRSTPRLGYLHEAIKLFEPQAIVTDDIRSYLWGKLTYASLLFAQALGQLGIADCLARPELEGVWRRLAGETLLVAKVEGITPRGFNGFEPAAFMSDAGIDAARANLAAIITFNRSNAKSHSGVWRDLAIRKRATEVDAIIGAIVDAGATHGMTCPTLTKLLKMIHEVELGVRPISDKNLDELAMP
jgi:2-dehydropantoate 2-reductase